MRIAFLSHSDASIYFFRIDFMRMLKSLGHDVIAIAPDGKFSHLISKEFCFISYKKDNMLNPISNIKTMFELFKIFKKLNLDVLQTSAHFSNIFGTLCAKFAGVKHIFNLVEGLGSFYVDKDFKSKFIVAILNTLYKVIFKISDFTIFVNEDNPNYFICKNIIDNNKVFIVRSVGVNLDKFNVSKYKNSQNFGLLQDFKHLKIILMASRAILHKGIYEFIQASNILSQRNDCVFVFCGESDFNNKTAINTDIFSHSNVVNLGFFDDMPLLYSLSYVFVLPSYTEGFSRSILEAMSMKKPIICTNVTGCKDAVKDGYNGLLCNARDANDLANKISFILDNPDMAQQFGENGYKDVLKFYNINIIVDKYIQIYRKFINV